MRDANVRRFRDSPWGTRRGSAAVELAMLLPFLALMFLAALDFGRVFYVTQTLQQCAEAGSLYASGAAEPSAAPNATDAANAACANGALLDPPLTTQGVTVTVNDAGGTATVTVAYDFPLLTPILAPTSSLHLTRTATAALAPVPGN